MPNELSEKVYPDGTVVKLRDDTAREQIANKVKKLARQDTSYTCTSTNFEYTGMSVSCPTGHTYIVRARLSFSNSAPSEIMASSSSTGTNVYQRYAYGVSGYITFMLIGGETAYIWGKWGAVASNSVALEIVDITN